MSLKNITNKLIAAVIAVYMVVGNLAVTGIGLTKAVAAIYVGQETPDITIQAEATRYVQYSKEKGTGAVLQTVIQVEEDTSKAEHQAETETSIEVKAPKIKGINPGRVTITKAEKEITQQSYNQETGLLTFSYKNANTKDEFEITYVYGQDAYIADSTKMETQVEVTATRMYANNSTKSKTLTKSIEKTSNNAELVNFETVAVSDIYKGYMYCNEANKTSYDTDYTSTTNVSVLNHDVAQNIELVLATSKFIKKDNKEINTSLVEYIATNIEENQFKTLLGQDGYINFYLNGSEEEYATIRYSTPDKKGNRTYQTVYADHRENAEAGKVDYLEGTKFVTLKTSNPITEGNLVVENQKVIKASENYGEKVENIVGIREITGALRIAEISTQDSATIDLTGTIAYKLFVKELKEPATQMGLEFDNNNDFGTLDNNNEVTVTIKLNDTNSSCKLFKAGTLELTLPKNSNSTIISASILQPNGLTLSNSKIENGKVVLTIGGEQKTYDTTNTMGGTTIVLKLKVDINDTVPTHKETLELRYTPNNSTTVGITKEVIISSLGDVLMLSRVNNYHNADTLMTYDSSLKTAEVEVAQNSKIATATIDIVNNKEDINNAELIGKLGYSDANLVSTFITRLNNQVTTTQGSVTYSEDGNTWNSDYSKAKYFKVSLGKFQSGKHAKVTLQYIIPEKLGYNEESYIQYQLLNKDTNGVLGTNNIEFLTEKKEIKTEESIIIDGLSPERIGNLDVYQYVKYGAKNLSSKDDVYEGSILTYGMIVKNITNMPLNNITLVGSVPAGTKLIKLRKNAYELEDAWEIDNLTKEVKAENITLEAGKTYKLEYQVIVDDITSNYNKIVEKNSIFINNELQKEYTLENGVKKGKIKTKIKLLSPDDATFAAGDDIDISLELTNTTDRQISGKLDTILSGYSDVENIEYNAFRYNSETDEMDEIEIDNNNITLYANEKLYLMIVVQTREIEDINTLSDIFTVHTEFTTGNETYRSNAISRVLHQTNSNISVELSGSKDNKVLDTESTVKNKDEIVYTIKVRNVGKIDLPEVNILDELPSGIYASKISYTQYVEPDEGENTTTRNIEEDLGETGKIQLAEYIPAGSTLTIYLTCNINTTDEVTELENLVKVKASDSSAEIASNSIKYYIDWNYGEDPTDTPMDEQIKPSNPGNQNETENPNPMPSENTTHSISGLAWLDGNKNGQREENETLLSGIKVTLVDMSTGTTVKDEQGNVLAIATDENGKYTFNNLTQGTYIVAFEFDTNQYAVTTYQKTEVDTTSNSDAIMNKITIDGTDKKAGVTNNIQITNQDVENIDIGLIENATFDLSLDKQIKKVEVINAQGTKTIEYENKNFAKVDLVAKYMNNTDVIVTYQFIIKNNGDITGYVDELKDNLPSGLEFNSELNKDWYKGNDGNLYTTALNGIAIKPGEESEIELILTKKTTENTTGVFSNNAEVTKLSNIEVIQENTEAQENNKSSADMVLSIKTGSAILYIGITLGSLAVIAAGAYLIKKKIINKGI